MSGQACPGHLSKQETDVHPHEELTVNVSTRSCVVPAPGPAQAPVQNDCFPSTPHRGKTATPTSKRVHSPVSVDSHSSQALSLRSSNCILPASDSYSDNLYIFKHMDMLQAIWPSIGGKATEEFPEFAALYSEVLSYRIPNFLGAQVQVQSDLNLDQWDAALCGYHDKDIYSFLRYGWPLGYLADTYPESVVENHTSAASHERHIQEFIQSELDLKALIGPFSQEPFTPWTRCSPMMTRPKKDSSLRRVIVDLSFPKGVDVNSAIDTKSYLGRDISFKLPSISDLVAKLQLDGDGAYIWKADLSRAYRQLRIDPIDTPLTGIKFKGKFYLDLCPPFGCRSSSAACQRVSNAVAYLMGQAILF